MATASVTLALNQSTFLAGMARAQSSVSALGASVGRIGSRGFLIAGTAAVAFGTAAAIGIKKAFDLGGSLADMSAISGRSAKEILLLRRALEDAGISMEKIDRFILTGQDRGQVIARALANMTQGDWRDAAASVGKQADILEKNAKTFDRVSDLLGRSGDKLQGFFVGAAGKIGNALLPLLEKFDKLDFASQGEKFGAGLLMGARALAGFFSKPELLFAATDNYLRAVILGIGNLLVATFKTSLSFLGSGMEAVFEHILSPNKGIQGLRKAINSALIKGVGTNMSGELNSIGRDLQRQIDEGDQELSGKQPETLSQRMDRIMKDRGTKFDVPDLFGAGNELSNANAAVSRAAALGRNILPMEAAASSNRKRGEIVVSGTGGGIDESLFSKNAAASEADFANRWSAPQGGASVKKDRTEALLEKVNGQLDKLNLTNEAQLQEWTGK